MLIVISPAKTLDYETPPTTKKSTEPVFLERSAALVDDARRYVNRAAAAGSPARLQTWAHVVHVWHMFYPQLTEARQAWDEIEKFFREIG